MEVARSIQAVQLPDNMSHIHLDFKIACFMIPAEEVDGDYYDISVDEKQQLWIGIEDISGHSLKAGMIMMITQSA